MYILKFLRRGLYFEIQYEKVVYVYMLIRYYMHNILSNMSKNRDVTNDIVPIISRVLKKYKNN